MNEIPKNTIRRLATPRNKQPTGLSALPVWGLTVRVADDDLVFSGRATCFGGDSDPDDNGETASGINTKGRGEYQIAAVALPMDGRQFPNSKSKAFHEALDGSPIPRVPWLTMVQVTIAGTTRMLPVIDLGPAKRTGNCIDLTPAAARLFDPKASATRFSAQATCRIVGGAKWKR